MGFLGVAEGQCAGGFIEGDDSALWEFEANLFQEVFYWLRVRDAGFFCEGVTGWVAGCREFFEEGAVEVYGNSVLSDVGFCFVGCWAGDIVRLGWVADCGGEEEDEFFFGVCRFGDGVVQRGLPWGECLVDSEGVVGFGFWFVRL